MKTKNLLAILALTALPSSCVPTYTWRPQTYHSVMPHTLQIDYQRNDSGDFMAITDEETGIIYHVESEGTGKVRKLRLTNIDRVDWSAL